MAFLVGGLSTIASCIRLYSVKIYTESSQPMKDAAPINTWSFIEINLGILCASAPGEHRGRAPLHCMASTEYTTAIKPLLMPPKRPNGSHRDYFSAPSPNPPHFPAVPKKTKNALSKVFDLSVLSTSQKRVDEMELTVSAPQKSHVSGFHARNQRDSLPVGRLGPMVVTRDEAKDRDHDADEDELVLVPKHPGSRVHYSAWAGRRMQSEESVGSFNSKQILVKTSVAVDGSQGHAGME